MVICLEQDADLHLAQLMLLPLTVSCFSKIQIGFTFLVPAHPGSPGKRAVKWVCVCVCTICLRDPFCIMRYCSLSIFKMANVCHVGILQLKFYQPITSEICSTLSSKILWRSEEMLQRYRIFCVFENKWKIHIARTILFLKFSVVGEILPKILGGYFLPNPV